MTTAPLFQLSSPLTVISPHLDDAVFSCGCLIAASPHTVVVTALAGVPDADTELTDWDRASGFNGGQQAVLQRRQEDARALALLGATPAWLDCLDGQYDKHQTPELIVQALARCAAIHRGGTIVAPMGLFHSDHILVNRACMMMMRTATLSMQPAASAGDSDGESAAPTQWLFYEDAIYRRLPGMLQKRLVDWWQEGLVARPVQFASDARHPLKMRAVEAYQSQLPLFNVEQLADIAAPERYWSLHVAPGQDND
jgi:LmbE family N-acetylglucosaminyl deacetylase